MRAVVIEDYAPLREALVQGLREAGYSVDSTGDGEEGLWYAQSFDYDVVILDLMLPGIDGLSIISQLRKTGSKVHILVLTAKDAPADRVHGLNLGADDYLVKPFVFDELLARVRALTRRRYDAKSPVIRIADLEIDMLARTVRRGERDIRLSAREYALLEFLAYRQGHIVSRTEIWEHLYDEAAQIESNVVDAFVRLLRKKIERSDLPPLIHTYRGQGYSLGLAA